MRLKHDKRLIIYRLIAIVLSICFISSKFIGNTFAKYTSSNFGSDSARVATFFVGDDNAEAIFEFSLDNIVVGEVKNFEFAIVNSHDDKITETAYTYGFDISTLNNLPLIITVEQKEVSGSGQLATITNLKATNGEMDCNTKSVHTYIINIKWDESKIDYEYTKEIDLLIINYTCTQID